MATVIRKTDKAIKALTDRTAYGPRERQLLIMCNGHRTSHDIVNILGRDALLGLLQLEAKGLLVGVSEQAASQRPAAVSALQQAPAAPVAPAPTVATAPTPAAPAAVAVAVRPPPRAKRPSMAAAKVYVTDTLQLQQNDSAKQIMQLLRATSDTQEIMELILTALDIILQRSGESYTERAVQRVFEVIPDENLEFFADAAIKLDIPLFERIARQYKALV